MNDEELKIGFMRRFNKVLEKNDMEALKRFIKNFELEDYTDFNEMYAALLDSIEDTSIELEQSSNPKEVLKRRYAKL